MLTFTPIVPISVAGSESAGAGRAAAPEPVGEVTVDGLGNTDAAFSEATVHMLMIDAETWAELKMPSVEVRADATAVYFVVDVMAHAPGVEMLKQNGRYVLRRKGAGFRICVAAVGAKLKGTADIKTVAAMAELQEVVITYKQSLYGLNPADFPGLSLMGFSSTNFGSKFLRSVGEAASAITDFLASHGQDPNKVTPTPVDLITLPVTGFDDQRLLWSHTAALEGIYHKKTVQEVIGHVTYWSNRYNNGVIQYINPVMVDSVYGAFGVKPNERPSDAQSAEAEHFLRKGQ